MGDARVGELTKLRRRAVIRIPCRISLRRPIVGSDGVFFSDQECGITRVGRQSLKVEWTVKAPSFEVTNVVSEGLLLDNFPHGSVGMMEASGGAWLWRADDVWCHSVVGDTLLVCSKDGNQVRVLKLSDGSVLSTFVLPEATTLFYADSEVLIAGPVTLEGDLSLHVMDGRSRAVIWTLDTAGEVHVRTGVPATEPIGFAIRATRLLEVLPERILSFDLHTGVFEWDAPVKKAVAGLIHSEGNRIYSYFSGTFTCVDCVDGRVVYQTRLSFDPLEAYEHAHPVPVDQNTLAYCTRRALRIFDLSTGELRAEYPIACHEGCFVDGRFLLNVGMESRKTARVHVVDYSRQGAKVVFARAPEP